MLTKKNTTEKIGIGIITCNREQLFKECVKSLPETDFKIVVNDGMPYSSFLYPSNIAKVIQHKYRHGVGRSKNHALRFLINEGCEHIFLCEDDIRIINPDVCREYIYISKKTGIYHFNYGYHGPRNKTNTGLPMPRKEIRYDEGVRIWLNMNLGGAFSYYRLEVLKQCGLMDPLFINMLEHVDHTNRIIKKRFHPPFWWFADIAESNLFIEDLDSDLSKTTIQNKDWYSPIIVQLCKQYFTLKNGYKPWNIPDVGDKMVEQILGEIKIKYSTI